MSKLGQPPSGVGLGGFALEPRLVGAAARDVGVALGHPLRRPAHGVEPGVCGIEMALLGLELVTDRRGIGGDTGATVGSVKGTCSGLRELTRLPTPPSRPVRAVEER